MVFFSDPMAILTSSLVEREVLILLLKIPHFEVLEIALEWTVDIQSKITQFIKHLIEAWWTISDISNLHVEKCSYLLVNIILELSTHFVVTAWNKIFKIRFETIPVLFQKPSHLNTLIRDLMCVFVIWGFVKIHVICKNILFIRKLKSGQIAFIDNHNWLTMASFLEHPCFVSKKWQTTDLNWF